METMPYQTLRNLLLSVFSVDVGLSESAEAAAMERFLENDELREKLRKELIAFDNSGLSWVELLENDSYCVYPADSEEEAKQFVMEKFGAKLLASPSPGV